MYLGAAAGACCCHHVDSSCSTPGQGRSLDTLSKCLHSAQPDLRFSHVLAASVLKCKKKKCRQCRVEQLILKEFVGSERCVCVDVFCNRDQLGITMFPMRPVFENLDESDPALKHV